MGVVGGGSLAALCGCYHPQPVKQKVICDFRRGRPAPHFLNFLEVRRLARLVRIPMTESKALGPELISFLPSRYTLWMPSRVPMPGINPPTLVAKCFRSFFALPTSPWLRFLCPVDFLLWVFLRYTFFKSHHLTGFPRMQSFSYRQRLYDMLLFDRNTTTIQSNLKGGK